MQSASPVVNLTGMPAEYQEQFSRTRAYIVNITEIEFMQPMTYGNFIIRGKQPSEEYSVTEILPCALKIDWGDNHESREPITPSQIANDIVRMLNADAGGDEHVESFLGVFVSAGPEPTPQELASATKRLEKFAKWCLNEGDISWQRYHMIHLIPDICKRFATHLKVEREWNASIQPQNECPGCGTRIRPGIAWCPQCGAVIDEKKAVEMERRKARVVASSEAEPPTASELNADDGVTAPVPVKRGHKKS